MILLESHTGFISCDVYCATVAVTHPHLPQKTALLIPHNTTAPPPLLPLDTTDSLEMFHLEGRLRAILTVREEYDFQRKQGKNLTNYLS